MAKIQIYKYIAITAFGAGRKALHFGNQNINMHAVNVVIQQLYSVSIETIEGPD